MEFPVALEVLRCIPVSDLVRAVVRCGQVVEHLVFISMIASGRREPSIDGTVLVVDETRSVAIGSGFVDVPSGQGLRVAISTDFRFVDRLVIRAVSALSRG